jgi:hypothetical protein
MENAFGESRVEKEGVDRQNLEESCMQAILLMLHYCRGSLFLVICVYRCASRTTFALPCTPARVRTSTVGTVAFSSPMLIKRGYCW